MPAETSRWLEGLKPMDAVTALYSDDNPERAAAIIASLSRAIFDGDDVRPATSIKRTLSRVSHRILNWTTRTSEGHDHTGGKSTFFRNRILERTGHPYATALLTSSRGTTVALVEGGDPMNGPYMLLVPEIKKNCGVWDKIFLDSVQGRDVQCRFTWETRATYEAAKQRLDQGKHVRVKAIAAGTGLSLLLVYDRLLRDGYSPDRITARITDRDEAGMAKTNRLLDTLAATHHERPGVNWRHGILARVEDVFSDEPTPEELAGGRTYDIVTAIGILEYFQGHAYTTTEHRLRLELPIDATTAHHLVDRITAMTVTGGHLITNTYRYDPAVRILELFGKRFDFRRREDLRTLLAAAHFKPVQLVGSGNIYDVKVYVKEDAANKE
jgi:hypothetical protein